ncbi:hypothetical protein QBC37DRAFT_465382 [Rhypophila decipiens]|uniref:Uncharacterized protein n=1 Tax=Rhypophila decipiens TaxID=261697 RepID=A0AAN6YIV2_9PEZI|nr:hypothetical protein QBC37DRAFT_465382 [Rhypophila decipiens]
MSAATSINAAARATTRPVWNSYDDLPAYARRDIIEIVDEINTGGKASDEQVKAFVTKVFRSWNTAKPAPKANMSKVNLDDTTVKVGVWKEDLPYDPKKSASRADCRRQGEPAFMKATAEGDLGNVVYKLLDSAARPGAADGTIAHRSYRNQRRRHKGHGATATRGDGTGAPELPPTNQETAQRADCSEPPQDHGRSTVEHRNRSSPHLSRTPPNSSPISVHV